jgi:hypothetical protein
MTRSRQPSPIATAAADRLPGAGSRTGRPALRGLLALLGAGLIAAASIGTAAAATPLPDRLASGDRHRFCADEWRAAAANPSVETLRAVGDCEIRRRIATLDALDARVAGSAVITGVHKDQLRKRNDVNPASYEVERAGLLELKRRIDAETDVRALRALIVDIAEEFRVYLLVVPKTYLVAGADATDKAAARLAQLATKLQELIDRAKDAGKDVTRAQALLDDMEAKTGQADALIDPVVSSIMPLSPADWNQGVAGPAMRAARTTIQDARELLRGARANAKQIIEILRA